MELYKIKRGAIKKFYESKRTFEQHWDYHLRYARHYDVIAYEIDWENRKWKEIRRVGPKKVKS